MAENKPGAEPAKNPVPDAASTKPVVSSEPTKVEEPKPVTKAEEVELDNMLGDEHEPDYGNEPAPQPAANNASLAKLRRLVSLIPRETPDDHVVWGAAGIKLTLGDLRSISRVNG